MIYPLSAETRIVHRHRKLNNRVVDYAIQHEGLLPSAELDPIMRVDCAHAEVHAHRFFPRPEKREIMRLISEQSDVEDTMQDSYDLILDESDENERCWRNAWQ